MNIHAMLAHPMIRAHIEKALAARGIGGDSHLVHVNTQEEAMLKSMGGSGTINPKTGLRQFNQVGPGGASGGQGGLGGADGGALGDGSGGLGGGVGGALGGIANAIGNAIDSVAGNFGSGWGSQGVAGGYGQSSNQNGAGSGYGGGNAGNGGYVNNYQTIVGNGGGSGGFQQPLPQAAPPPPPPPPVTTAPMMSAPSANLIGSRFGAMPSWATGSYQIGTAPTSYPTPGVNTADVTTGAGQIGGQVGGGQMGGGQMGQGGPAGQPQLPAIGSPQAIAAGIGTFPSGIVGQATAGAYSPQMLALLSKFGITPNPVQHQLNENKQAAWHGVVQQDMAHPYAIQGAQSQAAPAQNRQAATKVTSSGATPAHPLQPTQAGALTSIMGSKPPAAAKAPAKAKTFTVGRGVDR